MTQMSKRRPASPKQAARCPAPVDRLLDPALFKALADGTRTALLSCLIKCGRSCTVTEVAECCSVDFSVVSRHLALLERAGVLAAEKSGRTVSYRVRSVELAQRLRRLAEAIAEHDAAGGAAAGGACGTC